LSKLRIGVAQNLTSDCDSEVAHCFEAAVKIMVKLVAYTEDVNVAFEAPWDVRNFEIFRYHQEMFERTPERYDPRTLDRIQGSAGVSELDYVRRREAWKASDAVSPLSNEVDLIISPTVPVVAPLVAELEAMDSAALRAYEVKHLLRNTIPFSFLWWPSISVPCGVTSEGLPVGLQISGRPGTDLLVLLVAEAFERART
jgi:aspartyl-tRNA(Asn)/glutamyl-tRNA(Gln) amidotransferase subunit A